MVSILSIIRAMKTSEVKKSVFAAVLSAAMCASANAGDTSSPAFVFLRPETSSFWHTATNGTISLPVDFPDGATRATLSVKGLGYFAVYDNVPEGLFDLTLPAATSPDTENVYDLELAFDGVVVRRAKLGLVQGRSVDDQGATRCIAPMDGVSWRRVKRRAVLPIPYGTTSFAINGEAVDTGLGGDQGWYALGPLGAQEKAECEMETAGVLFSATLYGVGGFIFSFK